MKHLLALLTVALAGAATTAFAGTPYTEETFLADKSYTGKYDQLQNPAILNSGSKFGTYDFDAYTVTLIEGYRLKISVGEEDIHLHVYDFVDNVGSDVQASALKGTAEGSGPVGMIGYRALDSNGNPVADSENIHPLNGPTDTEVLQRYYEGDPAQPYQVVRNSYYLGEFKANTDYELYVSYNADGKDGKWSYTNEGSGSYLVQKDALMSCYLSKNFYNTINAKANEFTPLVQVNNKSFGLRTGPAFGSPLPGGTAIYVVAGLFALGFIVVRRRKEIAA